MTRLFGYKTNVSPLLYRSKRVSDNKLMLFIIVISAFTVLFLSFSFATAGHNFICDFCELMEGDLFNTDYSDITKILNFGGGAGVEPYSAQIWEVVVTAYNSMSAIGYALVTLFCLLDVMEKVQADNLTPELIMRALIKLFIGLFLIANGLPLVSKLIEIGNSITNIFAKDVASTVTGYTHKKLGLFEAIGQMCKLIVPWLLSKLAKLVIYLVAFSRLIQIGIYVIFAPVGMANIYEGGLNSSGFRYLKKFLAVVLQGAMILAILVVVAKINLFATDKFGFGTFFTGLALSLLQVMLIVKSQTWANDVLGV